MSQALERGGGGAWWSFDALWVRAGAVLAVWVVALLVENLVVLALFGREFAGSWETTGSRRWVVPIALAALLPAALLSAALGRWCARWQVLGGVLGAIAGAATAWGVSFGRHMANPLVRAPFVTAVALVGGGCVAFGAPRIASAARRNPALVALAGGVGGALAWCADLAILPRLYPVFHFALFAVTLGLWALVAVTLNPKEGDSTRAPAMVAAVALLAGAASIAYAPSAARHLAACDNLRIVLTEHAPLGGRAVWLGARLAPPPADEATTDATSVTPPGELPRALDWTGHDIVLLTVDALRADHLSSYGYARPTTPNLDALAAAGMRFDAAYCPTPHTSYSIASLMTGKYMRPLIALGLGEDSDTWAALLRRYGYRTAAFYPPAVFFIDGDRFQGMHERGLDFEYRKEEFASPQLRARQVGAYLKAVPAGTPLFLWVHFFEPHEPYVAHPEHPFGTTDVDRYDSEVAAADEGIGTIVQAIRAARPGAIVLATADHGEEFGEHGGRYHGTTVYEEQARVPLIIDGPGVAPGATNSAVQTIDLLPTVLSALGIPRPARLRGRDLGPLLAGKAEARSDPGLAFAETDEYTLLARGDDRLVCARRAAACSLFDRAHDPLETHDVASADPAHTRELRRMLTTLASEHGRFEHGEEANWPEALRRGIAGDAEAAADVAALLDDVNATVRAKAAEVSYDLHAPDVAPAMRRASLSDAGGDNDPVRRWCSLALVRMGEPPDARATSLLHDSDPNWRRPAALAFAEKGDGRGASDLADWWNDSWDERQGAIRLPFVRATEILAAMAKVRARPAVAPLVRSLADVRLRPFVADALAAIGDASAREPLARTLALEPQVTARAREARALLALGGASWSSHGDAGAAPSTLDVTLDLPKRDPDAPGLRLVALTAKDAPCEVHTSAFDPAPSTDPLDAHAFDLPSASGRKLHVSAASSGGLAALFLLSAAAHPAQEPADAGAP